MKNVADFQLFFSFSPITFNNPHTWLEFIYLDTDKRDIFNAVMTTDKIWLTVIV